MSFFKSPLDPIDWIALMICGGMLLGIIIAVTAYAWLEVPIAEGAGDRMKEIILTMLGVLVAYTVAKLNTKKPPSDQ